MNEWLSCGDKTPQRSLLHAYFQLLHSVMSSLKKPLDVSDRTLAIFESSAGTPNFDFGQAPMLLETSKFARARAGKELESLCVRGSKPLRRPAGHAYAGFRPDLLPGNCVFFVV